MINHVNNWEKANQEKTNESVTVELERYKERVKTFEQRLNVDLSTREKMIDSQMDDMIKEKLALKQQIDSLEQNLSNQIKEKEYLLQTFTVFKNESKEKENKYIDKEIDLEKKIKELDNIVYKVGQSAQTVHMLTKPQVFYDDTHKQALGYQNPFYLKKAQQIKPTLYDGSVISSQHVASSVINDEETLILEEVNFGKHFVPQQELSDEQAFWLQTSHPNTDQSASSPVKIEAPRELPKVSLVNTSLKKLKYHLGQFDTVVKKRITPDAITEGEWGEAYIDYLKHTQEHADILQGIVKQAKAKQPLDNALDFAYVPSSSSLVNDSLSRLFSGTVRFRNDQVAKIIGYGDYQLGNNLEGVDLLSGSRDTNLYTISLDDMLKTSSICLLSKASKTKSWLWHRRLSHLNFGTLNKLAKDGLARGIPKLKFQKDHLCSACALGKSKKSSHQPKAEDTNQEKLYLLHMDLCGPMRVESINGKKYILVIVDDYSRFTWVRFLRSKDEAPDAIIKCIKNIQVRLNATVRNVRTNNGTEFVNQTLRDFYENVGISHQTFVARTPQQNDVVERRNRTLVEAARTMLIFSKAPLFLWAEAINTACYTQNHSLIRLRYNKTPYELMHDKKPDLSFLHVFGSLCYPTNDSEDLGKLNAKADIGIFVGYAPAKKAFRIYNRRTQKIMETIHVTFDELTAMASEQFGLGPVLQFMTPATTSLRLVPIPIPQQPFPVAAAPRVVDTTESLVSTSIDLDAPSTSIPSTQEQQHSPIIYQGFEESPKTPHFHDDPLHESLHEDSTS
ncbi:retrovirus-related pol polyprotein from transposon TNT 1-94 [Tanacetum coccineum]